MDIDGHELIGQRRVGRMPTDDLVRMWLAITSKIVKYGFAIEYKDLEEPKTGIFNGLRITLDPDVEFEMQCFILLHLFGHSIQWVAPSIEHKLDNLRHTDDKEVFLKALHAYEFEAAQFGMRLLHEVGVTDLDKWYSDFVETDWVYVDRFYREGEIPEWADCVSTADSIIEPIPIPELKHREVAVRFAF